MYVGLHTGTSLRLISFCFTILLSALCIIFAERKRKIFDSGHPPKAQEKKNKSALLISASASSTGSMSVATTGLTTAVAFLVG